MRILAASVCCSLFGCSTSPAPSADLDGRVDEKMEAAAAALKYPPGTFIRINSFSGSVVSGYRVAEIIRKKRLGIEVADRCLSACASMIFIAAPKRRILPGGVVAFHGSNSGFLLFSRQSVGPNIPPVHPETRVFSRLEMAIYRQAGAHLSLLYSHFAKAGRICYSPDNGDGPFKGTYRLGTRITAYAPSSETLRNFGVEVEGENAEGHSGPGFYLPENPSVSISLDNGTPLTPQAVDAQVRAMRIYRC